MSLKPAWATQRSLVKGRRDGKEGWEGGREEERKGERKEGRKGRRGEKRKERREERRGEERREEKEAILFSCDQVQEGFLSSSLG
jgi:hypothetical protein